MASFVPDGQAGLLRSPSRSRICDVSAFVEGSDLRAPSSDAISTRVSRFIDWLVHYGETSYDHQSFFAGPIGGRAKSLYYRSPVLGVMAVAPMILCEAFFPATRQLFWHRQRFPIADAHYAMGFASLARLTGESKYYDQAVHFLTVLEGTRCPGYREFCWGYPFDWVTRTGVMAADTPLITTTPYVYEAFSDVHRIDGKQRWLDVMESTARHAANDIKDREVSPDAATAGYNPLDSQGGVVNASAYRAFLLMRAAADLSRDDYRRTAERNLNYVLGAQQADGSWFYATDGVRNFVDHFHTCFVLKALAKIEALTGHARCSRAIEAGVAYYVRNLFDDQGLPKPFAAAPRLTVYKRELYDYAECINLATLLRGRFSALDERLQTTLSDLLNHWQKPDGSFRARRLLLGWDNVPMHRWAQAQLFRSLSLLLGALEAAYGAPEQRSAAAVVPAPSLQVAGLAHTCVSLDTSPLCAASAVNTIS